MIYSNKTIYWILPSATQSNTNLSFIIALPLAPILIYMIYSSPLIIPLTLGVKLQRITSICLSASNIALTITLIIALTIAIAKPAKAIGIIALILRGVKLHQIDLIHPLAPIVLPLFPLTTFSKIRLLPSTAMSIAYSVL